MMIAKGMNKMRPLLFFIPLFLILVIEGIAIDFLPQFLAKTNLLITPHWIFMFLLLMTFKFDTNNTFYAVIYGAFFGILVDIVYSDVLGIYMFIYPFVIYLVHISKHFLHTNFYILFIIVSVSLLVVEFFFYMLLIIASASLLVVEVLLFIVYSFVLSLDLSQAYFLFNRYIPTLIANLLFLLLLYVLFSGMMERWRRDLFKE